MPNQPTESEFLKREERGAANGVASLGADAKQLLAEQPDRVLNPTGLFSANYVQVGETNDTSSPQQLLTAAGSGYREAGIAPRIYLVEGLVIPPLVTLSGWGGGTSRYGVGAPNRWGRAQLRPPRRSSTYPTRARHCARSPSTGPC